jgi:hypothetical protein
MNANLDSEEILRARLLVELTQAAWAVISRYAVPGVSAAMKLDLWEALRGVLRQQDGVAVERQGWTEGTPQREVLIAQATDAAYRVTLVRGLRGSFLDFQLELWGRLGRVICSSPTACEFLRLMELFRKEAEHTPEFPAIRDAS